MTVLLDGNVLIALLVTDHERHPDAVSWFAGSQSPVATCPITQGTLVRFLLRAGRPSAQAVRTLDLFVRHERHTFWPDDQPFSAATLRGVVGHRQVTDAYLAALARARDGRLLTADRGLASLHADVADLLGAAAD